MHRPLILVALALAIALGWAFCSDRENPGSTGPSMPGTSLPQSSPSDLEQPADPTESSERTELRAAAAQEVAEQAAAPRDLTDVVLRGRVIERGTNAPIAGARVGRLIGWGQIAAEDELRTDSEGRFEWPGRTWMPTVLNVIADGYGLAVVQTPAWHEADADELKIDLSRVASLRVTVRDASGIGMPGVRVTLFASKHSFGCPNGDAVREAARQLGDPREFEEAEWSALTDADGVASFVDLPARVPLTGVATIGKSMLMRAPQGILLDPASARSIEWRLGETCTIHGIALEMDGRPASSLRVCIEPAPVPAARFFSRGTDRTRLRTVTDAHGRFTFTDIGSGDWRVGPEPTRSTEMTAQDPAPFGQLLRFAREVTADVEVRVQRGLYVRGRVIDAQGGAVPRASVRGESDDGTISFVETANDARGEFTLGPLLDREYTIRAMLPGRAVESEAIRVRPGDTDLVLQLREGGVLRGIVVDDASGEPCRARLVLSRSDSSDWCARVGSRSDGSFEFAGLHDGGYCLAASTPDGRVGILRGLAIVDASTVDGLRIEIEPGAIVRIRYDGPHAKQTFDALCRDARIGSAVVARGADAILHSLAGDVIVRATTYPAVEHFDLPLTLRVGETREVVFDGAWK